MRRAISAIAMAAAVSVALAAQDNTVKSRTQVEADDDATVVSLTRCLRQNVDGGRYTLIGATAAAGGEVTTRNKVKTDVDDDDVEVKATTRSKADDGAAIGTSGRIATYLLVPRDGVALTPHVGHRVQISAVMLHPGEDDADVKIKDTTTVDRDDASDTTKRLNTKIEVEDARHGEYTVVSVKPLAGTCSD
jgi:hypothetical protein